MPTWGKALALLGGILAIVVAFLATSAQPFKLALSDVGKNNTFFLVFVLVWAIFLLPGLAYMVWQRLHD